jgi:hypothetical protein
LLCDYPSGVKGEEMKYAILTLACAVLLLFCAVIYMATQGRSYLTWRDTTGKDRNDVAMMADVKLCNSVSGFDTENDVASAAEHRWYECTVQRGMGQLTKTSDDLERNETLVRKIMTGCGEVPGNEPNGLKFQEVAQQRDACMNRRGWKETSKPCGPHEC